MNSANKITPTQVSGKVLLDCLFKNTIRSVALLTLILFYLIASSKAFAQATCQAFDPPDSQFGLALDNVLEPNTVSRPVGMVQPPNDSTRWFVVDNEGKVDIFNHGATLTRSSVLVDLQDRVLRRFEGRTWNELGLLSIAVHPNFNSNGYVYLYYSAQGPSTDFPLAARLARYTSTDNGQTLDPSSEKIIFELPRDTVHHWGGQMWFHPVTGYLYMSIGDGGRKPKAQRYNDMNGSFIRIDVDSGDPYSIPADNPFVNDPDVLGEIYAKGLRNPWQWSFDSVSHRIFLGDVGAANWEEINEIKAGENYGWPIKEGFECFNASSCNSTGLTDPVVAYPHDVAGFIAVLGGYVYRGSDMPNFYGKYIYGDVTGRIWTIDPDDPSPTPDLVLDAGPYYYGFVEDHNRELYLLGDNSIEKLSETTVSSGGNKIPDLLSQTGCFDTTNPLVADSALIPYELNAPLWSDNADKQRWMRLPDNGEITITSTHDWNFPVGSVLVKNFKIQNKLIETRLFVRHDNGDWAGYSYEWDDNETDATLLPAEGKSKVVGSQTWLYPSRSQCSQCHTPQAGFVLGPETAQLNLDLPSYSQITKTNQLTELDNMNIFANANFSDPSNLPKLASISDESQTKHWRARSYLYSNCAMCHTPGGSGRGPEDFRYSLSDAQINAINVDPSIDDLGVTDGKLIFPGQPSKSIMSLRMHSLDSAVRMPPLATSIEDTAATNVVDQWITSLTSPAPESTETCGAPPFTAGSPDGVYLWRYCGDPLRWYFRAFADDTTKHYTGKVISDVEMTTITPSSVETTDSLVTSQAGKQVSFDFKTNRGNNSDTDGFEFSVDANASTCLSFDYPVHTQIRLGANAIEVNSNSLDLSTLSSCNDVDNTTLSIADLTTVEGGKAKFTVRLSAAASENVTVDYQTNDGTATAGADYVARSGKIIFSPGDTVKTRTVTILQDNLSEGTENLSMTLSNPVNASLAQTTATATITDDDTGALPQININDVSITEGGTAALTVSLSPASSSIVTVNYQTTNGTATAGSDYTSNTGTVTFNPNDTSKTINVNTVQDQVAEPTESFNVALSNPSNASLGDATGEVTINDDDTNSGPTLSIADLTTMEGGKAVFTIRLSPAASSNVTVNYQTNNGTATAGADYVARSGRIVFSPGDTVKTRTVTILQDNLTEGTENLTMTLSNPANAALAQSTATATVTDDDTGPISACGEPSIDRAVDQAIFLWKDCSGDGKWHVMATAGGALSRITFAGGFSTDQSFSGGVTPISIESNDVLTSTVQTINFNMKVSSPWRDGFEFNVATGNTCMTLTQPGGYSVLVGASRSPLTPPFNIETLGNCLP